MAEIRKAVSISRCTFLIHRIRTTSVRLHAEFRRALTSWSTEFKTDADGLAPFIAGKIGLPVASQSPTKRSRNSGGLQGTVRRSRFVHEHLRRPNDFPKAPRAHVALFQHPMAAE